MTNKKVTSLVLVLCLALSTALLAACGTSDKLTSDELNKKISDKVQAYRTDLTDSQDSLTSNAAIMKYLTSWAKTKNISYRADKSGNLILSVKSSQEYKEAAPTVIICPYEGKQIARFIDPIAMSLYIAKNNESTGKLTVVFTPKNGMQFDALQKLSSKYISDDAHVITLNAAEKGLFSVNTAAGSSYQFTQKVSRVKSKLKVSYRFTLSGIPTGQPDGNVRKYANPITELESILTSLKNRNDSFELASFTGGSDSTLYASSASMVINIDANDEDSFVEWMTKKTEQWLEKHKEDYPDATYTFQKVNTPANVYSKEDANKLVSFMYTMLNGEYYKDDDGNLISITNISSIHTDKTTIRYDSVAYSLDPANLKEIDTGETTLANLSGIQYKKTGSIPIWNGKADTDYTKSIQTAYKAATGKALTYSDSVAATCASYASAINRKAELISITVNDNIVNDVTGTLMEYLLASNEAE